MQIKLQNLTDSAHVSPPRAHLSVINLVRGGWGAYISVSSGLAAVRHATLTKLYNQSSQAMPVAALLRLAVRYGILHWDMLFAEARFSLALSIAVLLLQRVTLSSLLIRIINEFLAFALLVYRSARDGIDWSEGWTVGRLCHTLVGVKDAFDCDKHFLQGLVLVPASYLHIYHSGAVNEVSWVVDLNLGHELDLGRFLWVVWSSDDVQRDETILKVASKS